MAGDSREKAKRKLVMEWDYNKNHYRLIAIADHTPGYEDHYLIEELGVDGLGEPRWTPMRSWDSKGGVSAVENLLTSAINSLLADRRRDGSVWCCYRIDLKSPAHCRARCVEVEASRLEYYYLDGRYDTGGNRELCLVSEVVT